jgi:hypothetical protein
LGTVVNLIALRTFHQDFFTDVKTIIAHILFAYLFRNNEESIIGHDLLVFEVIIFSSNSPVLFEGSVNKKIFHLNKFIDLNRFCKETDIYNHNL